MTNPFSNSAQQSTGKVDYEPVLNSALTCEYCLEDSSEGTYWPQARRLVWDCDACARTNIVKDIEL